MPGVCFDGLLGLLTHFVVNQTIEDNYFYRLWPAALDVVLSRQQAQARRWWMGSLKFAIGLEPPFLRILPAAFTSSFLLPLLPSCCWIGVLKVFFCSFWKVSFLIVLVVLWILMKTCWIRNLFSVFSSLETFVFWSENLVLIFLDQQLFQDQELSIRIIQNLSWRSLKIFKMSICSRSVFVWEPWKVASLGVLNSLSPAVFFLWLYYTTAGPLRLFADSTRLEGIICTY